MVELGRGNLRLPLGEDLVVGHAHARVPPDTAGSSHSPRVKRRIRAKTSLAELERKESGRSRVPEPPRLRTLARDPAEVPISEGSLVPANSPLGGIQRAHLYTPVGAAVGSSSFEVVSSARDRAASERGLNESMETVPIARANSSPSIIQDPSQVMSPNLVAGSAPSAAPMGSGMDTDAGVQAILQQWQEVKTEQGTVERTYTQCAQSWPLASHVKLEGIESAIHILRQACDYLHEGMVKLSSVTDQKCDTGKVQRVTAGLMATLRHLLAGCFGGSQRTDVVTSRVDEMAGEAANIRNRLEGLERRVGMVQENQQHDVEMRELRAGHEQHDADLRVLCHNANEYQADIQARDNEIFEKELIFKLCVKMDEFREDIKKVQTAPGRESTDASAYQEQAIAFRQGLDRALQQMETQERKIREGEQRHSQLQEEMQNSQRMPKPEKHEGISDEIRHAVEDRIAKIEEKHLRHQQQTSNWQEDSVRDFQAVEAYLTRLHNMVMEGQQTEASSSTPKPPRMTRLTTAAWKGDLRVEVESSDTFRVGEVVLLGEQEAKMVIDKGSLIFRFPIEKGLPGRDCNTTVGRK